MKNGQTIQVFNLKRTLFLDPLFGTTKTLMIPMIVIYNSVQSTEGFFKMTNYTKLVLNHLHFVTSVKFHKDNIEHMLFACPVIKSFWYIVHDWLSNIGYKGYISSVERIIFGLENTDLFSHIILTSKIIIYNAMKADKKPHIPQVIADIERIDHVKVNVFGL